MSDCKARLYELGTVIQCALLILFARRIAEERTEWIFFIGESEKQTEVICSVFGTRIRGAFLYV